MSDARIQQQVVTAARFYIDFTNLGRIAFSELQGITSKVVPTEYIYNDDQGRTVHTKQYGKTEPPTITLKRGLDVEGNTKLLAWHAMARAGDPRARGDGTLTVIETNREISYRLVNGWCQELIISGMKAGDSAVAFIECKICCEEILPIHS